MSTRGSLGGPETTLSFKTHPVPSDHDNHTVITSSSRGRRMRMIHRNQTRWKGGETDAKRECTSSRHSSFSSLMIKETSAYHSGHIWEVLKTEELKICTFRSNQKAHIFACFPVILYSCAVFSFYS
uniref:Uncharacterized protein n=1 Tax=Molossus molossus TaxID=27622 RepID=A0A7J8BKQ6_MOLMO|nr:hypothetical protein HJG59_010166 [Molossus molossus]